ncbi:MAG: hypothetical protein Q8O30_03480, partial [Candidatus Omnitrophota bacterium]|nr:hypothetical protein [Candidatus Omnitrophota bacterium]
LIKNSSRLKKEVCLPSPTSGRQGSSAEVAVSISFFIPKPHTYWEREGMVDVALLEKRQNLLKSKIAQSKKIKLKFHNLNLSYLEAILSRGDRRLSSLIESAFKAGARLDSWYEYFQFSLWQEAFKKCGIEAEFYLRARSPHEILPWQFIGI